MAFVEVKAAMMETSFFSVCLHLFHGYFDKESLQLEEEISCNNDVTWLRCVLLYSSSREEKKGIIRRGRLNDHCQDDWLSD